MKTHYLFLALTVGALGIAATQPWLVNPQPTQIAQAAPIADKSPRQANSQTAQSVAAKVTVRIRVGQGLGSGVLLGKKGKTYLVLTNAHVVRAQAGISIQTPDGQTHTARRVKDPQVGNFDVALLEFDSTRTYQLAKSDVSSRDDFALFESKQIFAAGFARDANTLKVISGTVKQLPQEPFVNGTQVGYATQGDIEQGMSGGPILDDRGNLVGINSTYAYPIKPVYTYADGTKAPPDKVAEYRQVNWGVPIYNLLTRLNPDILYGYKQLPKLHRTVTPSGYMAELDRKARLVTVRIEYSTKNGPGNGSGVIVAREGNNYYVLTSEHVVANVKTKELYLNQKIITHDHRIYTISPSEIKRSGGTDLAIVKFTSTQPYQVATLGNYSVSNNNALVFPGGWPAPAKIGSQQWQWQLNPGIILSKEQGDLNTQDKGSFRNGYDLIYNSVTYGGMSGGPVFDNAGRVIGIHGKAEGHRDIQNQTQNILGKSLGISIRTFIGTADLLNVPVRNLQIVTKAPGDLDDSTLASVNLVRSNIAIPNNYSNAERWIEYGNQLYRLGKTVEAVTAFDRAIKLVPDSLDAHYGKGLALVYYDNSAALKALDRAIKLVRKGDNSKFYYLWTYRSLALKGLNRYSEALDTISEAIRLESEDILLLNEKAGLLTYLKQYPRAIEIYDQIIEREQKDWAYNNRASVKSRSGDKKGAIADYDIAIRINPQFAETYSNRGVTKLSLGDKQGAIADYDIAIRINPQFAGAYSNRGMAKLNLGDKQGAIADYNIAIGINPQFALAYFNRGFFKHELGNKKGAIDDYDIAIRINPQFAQAYNNRGNVKLDLGYEKNAIADYDLAVRIDPQLTEAYFNRASAKSSLGDRKGAIADYDIAIRINPQFAQAYNNRGINKFKLGDKHGAISDCDLAISVDPQYAQTYGTRAAIRYELGDKKGAFSDYSIAAQLFKAQNNIDAYEKVMSLMQSISN